MTGRRTGFSGHVRAALRALDGAGVRHAVVGAAALAVRGLPRMTRDVDVVVGLDDAFAALTALEAAGFRSVVPVRSEEEPEPMYALQGPDESEVDLLVAVAEPEASVLEEAPTAEVFGVQAPVAELEHLLLMYLYSSQPKHLGDFARIVTESEVDLRRVERFLDAEHPEMLPVLRERVEAARHPPPPPPRPPRRR